MRQLFYQRTVNIYQWIVNGMETIAMWKGFMGDATRWINIPFALIFTGIVFIIYFCILRYIKKKPAALPGYINNLPRFRKALFWRTVGGLSLLWFGVIYSSLNQATPAAAPIAVVHTQRPVFDTADRRFKILIREWEPECEHEHRSYNIAGVLQKSLEALGEKYHIPLVVHYLKDTIEFRNFTRQTADSLVKYHHANNILYGSYSLKECESDHKDKISFNYLTDLNFWDCSEFKSHTEYKLEEFNGLDDIRQGKGEGEPDFIIHYIAAIALIKQQQIARAIEMLRLIKDYDKNDELLFLMGNCYAMLNDQENTRIFQEKTIKINPANMEARIHLSVALSRLGRTNEAEKVLNEVLAMCPDNIRALRNLGLLHQSMGHKMVAWHYLNKIFPLTHERTAKKLAIHGMTFNDLKVPEQAKYAFEASLALADNHKNQALLGETYLQLKDTPNARKCYERAIAQAPYEAEYHYKLGALYHHKKDYQKSQSYFAQAVRLNPLYDDAWAFLALSCHVSGDNEKARQYIDKALSINPASTTSLQTGFWIYKSERAYIKAKELAEAFLKRVPGDITMWDQLGHVYGDLNDFEKALSCFRRTQQMLPENHVTLYNIAAMYSLMHNKKDAIKYFTKAAICNHVVTTFVDRDRSFSWLQGDEEFCSVLAHNSL